jgi:putative copper export protein
MVGTMDSGWRFVHLVAAAYWLGGLIVLGIVAVVANRTLTAEGFGPFMRRAGWAFAAGAGLAGLILAASGVALARQRITSVEALATTAWGRTLTLKSVLAAVLVLMTVVHSWLGSRTQRPAVVGSRVLSATILVGTLGIFYLAGRLAG